MSRRSPLLWIIILLCSTISACSGETLIPQLSSTPNSKILFQDDFSDPSSGWLTERETNYVIDYESGGFRIWGDSANYDYWSVPSLNFTDMQIEVDAEKSAGPDNNSFGILCRYDHENFYGFLISSDGYYGISKRKNGNHQILGADGMKISDVIKKGPATNHIRADCIGSRLTLYVNNEKLLDVQDNEFASGDVGLIAGNFDTGGVDIKFKNFVVQKP